MASCDMSCVFQLNGAPWNVSVDAEHGLCLKEHKPNAKKAVKERKIEWKHVVRAEAGRDAKFLDLHTVREKKNELAWEHLVLRHEEAETVQTWVASINGHTGEANPQKPKHLLVFVNPISGRKKGVTVFQKAVKPLFEFAAIKTEVIVTEGADHIVRVIAECDLSAYDGVVSVGGDGTFTRVVDALMRRTMKDAGKNLDAMDALAAIRLPIGIIPAGTGQGMTMVFHHCKDVVTAAIDIIQGGTVPCHIMAAYAGQKLVMYTTLIDAIGFFGDLINTSESKRSLGVARYLYATWKTLFNIRKFDAEVHFLKVDNQKSPDAETPQWEVVKGRFTGISAMTCNLLAMNSGPEPCRYYDNDMLLLLFSDEWSTKDFLGFMAKMAKGGSGRTMDGPHTASHLVSDVKIVLPPSDGSTAGRCLDLDGECLPYEDLEVRFRYHHGAVAAYGRPPKLSEAQGTEPTPEGAAAAQTTPPEGAGSLTSTPLEGAGAEKSTPLEGAEAEKSTLLEGAGAEKSTPLDNAGAAKSTPLEGAGAEKSTLEGAGAAKSTPLESAGAEKSTPLEDAGAEKSTPLEGAEAEKSTLLEGAGAEKSTPLEDAGAEKSTPLEGAGAEKSTPLDGAGTEKSTLEGAGAAKSTPLESAGAEKSTPLEDAGAEKSTPLEGAGAAKSTPLEGAGAEKSTPLEGAGAERSTPPEGAGAEKSTLLEGAEVKKSTPLETAGAEKSTPLEGAGAAKSTLLEGAGAENSTPLEGAGAAKSTPLEDAGAEKSTPLEGAGAAKSTPLEGAGAEKSTLESAGAEKSTLLEGAEMKKSTPLETAGAEKSTPLEGAGAAKSTLLEGAGAEKSTPPEGDVVAQSMSPEGGGTV